MVKYIHTPKTKNIVLFSILIVVGLLSHLPFILVQKSIVAYNLDLLLAMHLLLPIIYGVVFCLLLSYILSTIETIVSNLKTDLQLTVLNVLCVLELFAGFAIPIFVLHQENNPAQIEFLHETVYFRSLIANDDLSSIYLFWLYMARFSSLACSAILFVAVARQSTTKKQIKSNQAEDQFKAEVNAFLGFDYETCDFYKQVHIPYRSLQQTDGTRGEFEVYHMLRKFGLTDAEYIFNREVPKNDGLNTELDAIVVHEKGVFVIENKHYTTRIYGKATDHDLIIIDHCGRKKSIYNPIKQNENHIIALREFLKSKDLYVDEKTTPIYSIVVFTAEGNDKTDDIISGISTAGTETKICTSQNVYYTVNQLISNSDPMVDINVWKIKDVLLELPVRKKYS